MKNIIFSIITLAIVTVACNKSHKTRDREVNNNTKVASETQSTAAKQNVATDSAVSSGTLSESNQKQDENNKKQDFSIAPIVKDYLALKNALVADNDKAAAQAGKQLFATLKKIDMKSVPANKHKDYMEIAENAIENAEHIGDNAGKIDHQREHLASLSKDINDLIALFGTTQKLYQDFCPMYNDGKGGVWISETKEIKNPYYGKEMLTCGSMKKEL